MVATLGLLWWERAVALALAADKQVSKSGGGTAIARLPGGSDLLALLRLRSDQCTGRPAPVRR